MSEYELDTVLRVLYGTASAVAGTVLALAALAVMLAAPIAFVWGFWVPGPLGIAMVVVGGLGTLFIAALLAVAADG